LTERTLGKGGIGSLPCDVGGGAVDGDDGLVEQAQVNRELRAVVRGVEDAPPENPDTLAFDIEEAVAGEPPGAILAREKRQTRKRQFFQTRGKGFGGGVGGEYEGGIGLGDIEEFGKETALGKKLVTEDFERRGGFRMRAEGEVRGIELAKDVSGLVGFAGVGVDNVLKRGVEGAGNRGFGNHAFKIALGSGGIRGNGGDDGARTRDLRRDRPAF
jgi:hypothetical protein